MNAAKIRKHLIRRGINQVGRHQSIMARLSLNPLLSTRMGKPLFALYSLYNHFAYFENDQTMIVIPNISKVD